MKLKQACSIYGDYGLNIAADRYVDDGLPLIRTSDFDDLGRLDLSTAKYVSEGDAIGKVLKLGDLLFSRSGTVGRCMVFNNKTDATYAAYLVRFRPRKEKAISRFIFYWSQSEHFMHQVRTETIESTIGNFNGSKFSNLLLPDIRIGTQTAIADFLDRETARIDQLIEKKQRMVELLGEKRGVVALECLSNGLEGFNWLSDKQSVAFRFKRASWAEMRVKSVVGFMTSGSRSWSNLIASDGEVFIQSGNIGRRMETDLRHTQRVRPQTGTEADRTLVKEHDVLVCITGGRTGAVGYVQTIDERAYINQHVCLLRARRRTILPELLAQILWSEIGQKQIELCQYGVKQGLGFSEVGNIKLPVPPRDQQPKIISEITASTGRIDAATVAIEQSLDRLREFRIALITAAVTGQHDVATWGKSGTTDRRLDDIEAELAAAAPPELKQARA